MKVQVKSKLLIEEESQKKINEREHILGWVRLGF